LISTDWWFPLGTYDRLINEWFGVRGLDDRANHALFVAGVIRPGLTIIVEASMICASARSSVSIRLGFPAMRWASTAQRRRRNASNGTAASESCLPSCWTTLAC